MPVSNLPLPGTHPPHTTHSLLSTFSTFPDLFSEISGYEDIYDFTYMNNSPFTSFFYYRSSTCFFTVFLNFDSSHYIHSKRTFGLDIWSPLYHDQCWWIHSPYPLLSPTFPFPIRSQLLSLLSNAPFRYLSPVSLYRFRWDLICLQFTVNIYLLIHY